ncbi:MAG: phosphate ABC transporter, permease protein PstA [Halothiobacillus sp. 24-54-40]|jgi:phosphate transport system permease protein|nr:MAG: phosphate ABC transporter, permease protein PstA [Halothiobacillus sp. 35-54-62]OYY55311.1 MAG: phosphate ABC transporter, permease protein PstA [Halothiobacillus sp. 28-55-5]OYZ86067.1 MAG: phosphate ABC transporter, permease protein PstA [Halothiobacillus sp. 24-54-40]OZA79834.1 MAG: phosphate ABC transporter, permease protein PstA [Halothiobacillus sp. 39-53-45]HQS03508.1 phosphate ABC transporter permease PstA [Halothiobacillus sp.]
MNESPPIKAAKKPRAFVISPLRRLVDALSWGLAALSFAVLIFALLHILVYVFMNGLPAINLKIFTEDTIGIAGGLRNALLGSLVLSAFALLIAVPIGVSAGVYLSEHGEGWVGKISRFLSDVLVGVPSIVLGYFGYIVLVIGFGWKFSLLAGAITLAILMLPYIARTSEMALRAVPQELREAAYGLGCPEWRIIGQVLLPAARIPILTGLLMALAIALGETAPLLYTAGWSNYLWTGHFTHEGVGYLTYVIWSFIGEPYQSAHQLAYAAAFLITFMVLIINISARLLIFKWRR